LDFASIDFKAVFYQNLSKIAGIDEKSAKICFANTIKTIKILQSKGIYTDVRTCVFNDTSLEQLREISKCIQEDENAKNLFWTLRAYSPIDKCDKLPKTHEEMIDIAQCISEYNPTLKIGVRAKGEPDGFIYFLDGEQKGEFKTKDKRRLVFGDRKRGGPVFE